ncbi:hypothetical protein C791_6120 [Amycolatopsis azurea DSM 43854]|uniref:Uncharacterized protein n=1 Tax=Amycolatopsis azurea DSM 43854 TaxID=1238180 RepID=M2QSY0_9PSEU|nr:hypothetical protein C791_6120 [Amycolatopsis azurea DSM 43854]
MPRPAVSARSQVPCSEVSPRHTSQVAVKTVWTYFSSVLSSALSGDFPV